MKTDRTRKFIEHQLTRHSDYMPDEFGDIIGEMMVIPEAKMWAYSLAQAIANSLGNPRVKELTKFKEKDRFWLLRDNRRYVGSCNWVCDLLGIDRRQLIRGVFKRRHELRANPCQLRIIYNVKH